MMKFFVLAASVSAAAITSASVKPGSHVVDAVSPWEFTFTPASGLKQNGRILITFPEEFTAPLAVTGATSTSLDGTLTAAANGHVITITRTGTQSVFATASVVLILAGIKNPATAKKTGVFKIATDDGTTEVDTLATPFILGVDITGAETGDLDKGAECVVTATAKAEKCKNAFFCKTGASAPETKCADRIAAEAKCTQDGSCVKDYICKGADGSKKCTSGAFSYGFTMLAVLAAFFL